MSKTDLVIYARFLTRKTNYFRICSTIKMKNEKVWKHFFQVMVNKKFSPTSRTTGKHKYSRYTNIALSETIVAKPNKK